MLISKFYKACRESLPSEKARLFFSPLVVFVQTQEKRAPAPATYTNIKVAFSIKSQQVKNEHVLRNVTFLV